MSICNSDVNGQTAEANPHALLIRPRRVRIEFAPLSPGAPPNDFYDGDAALTEVFHALSVHFPAGETFFIDAVLKHSKFLKKKHPKLWEQVLLFCRQEAMHTAVHEQWDERAEREFGHPMAYLEQLTDLRLQVGPRRAPTLFQLATTACLEHFTAGLARVLLDSAAGDHVLRCMSEPFRSLWIWHAVEELEHKAVAFDVYHVIGARDYPSNSIAASIVGYFRRTFVMLVVAPMFLVRVSQAWWMLIRHRKLPVLQSIARLLRFLLWWPGLLTRFFPQWLRWFIPGYHPSKHTLDGRVVARHLAELESRKEPDGYYVFTTAPAKRPTESSRL